MGMSLAPFSDVVATHGSTVLRTCRSMLAPSEADDAWADTFLSALQAYPDLDEDANVAGWLVTIARRRSIDIIRRRERTAVPVADGFDTAAPDPPTFPDEELRAALSELSDRQRTSVIAHHVAGLPYAEVAELLGSTPAAARRSAADGIAKLRTSYRRTTDHDNA